MFVAVFFHIHMKSLISFSGCLALYTLMLRVHVFIIIENCPSLTIPSIFFSNSWVHLAIIGCIWLKEEQLSHSRRKRYLHMLLGPKEEIPSHETEEERHLSLR